MCELRELCLEDVMLALKWRNDERIRPMLRTPEALTEEQQERFYFDVVCNPDADSLWWGMWEEGNSIRNMVAMVGLTGIQIHNSIAEISLIQDPNGRNLLDIALSLLLEKAKGAGIQTVYAEVYECSPHYHHWHWMAHLLGAYHIPLPRRKKWGSNTFDSLYISFNTEVFNDAQKV